MSEQDFVDRFKKLTELKALAQLSSTYVVGLGRFALFNSKKQALFQGTLEECIAWLEKEGKNEQP